MIDLTRSFKDVNSIVLSKSCALVLSYLISLSKKIFVEGDLIDFEIRSNTCDELLFQKDYPSKLHMNLNKYDNHNREIELLKIPYSQIKLKNYNQEQITKDNNDPLTQQSYSKYSINETKRKKLMNVLDDLVKLRKNLENK